MAKEERGTASLPPSLPLLPPPTLSLSQDGFLPRSLSSPLLLFRGRKREGEGVGDKLQSKQSSSLYVLIVTPAVPWSPSAAARNKAENGINHLACSDILKSKFPITGHEKFPVTPNNFFA